MHTIREMAEYLIYLSERDKTENREEAIKRTVNIIRGKEMVGVEQNNSW